MPKRKIVHLQLHARSRLPVARFYAGLFSWSLSDFPEMDFTALDTGNGELGISILQATAERPGAVAWFIESEDVAADLKAVEARGGRMVVPPMDVPGVGQMAFFTDPEGNIIGLAHFANGARG